MLWAAECSLGTTYLAAFGVAPLLVFCSICCSPMRGVASPDPGAPTGTGDCMAFVSVLVWSAVGMRNSYALWDIFAKSQRADTRTTTAFWDIFRRSTGSGAIPQIIDECNLIQCITYVFDISMFYVLIRVFFLRSANYPSRRMRADAPAELR